MVLEVAILDVRPGTTEAFEAAFAQARSILSSMAGHQRHELRRCIENDHRYLLLVWWDTLEHHTRGFRGAPEYERWSTGFSRLSLYSSALTLFPPRRCHESSYPRPWTRPESSGLRRV